MSDDGTFQRAFRMAAAGSYWARVAKAFGRVADDAGETLEALGHLLSAASNWQRSRECCLEAMELWSRCEAAPEDAQCRMAKELLREVEERLDELDERFTDLCAEVVARLESGGDWEELVEAGELAARNQERLAEGKSLAEMYGELAGHSCACHDE